MLARTLATVVVFCGLSGQSAFGQLVIPAGKSGVVTCDPGVAPAGPYGAMVIPIGQYAYDKVNFASPTVYVTLQGTVVNGNLVVAAKPDIRKATLDDSNANRPAWSVASYLGLNKGTKYRFLVELKATPKAAPGQQVKPAEVILDTLTFDIVP